jgi:hypothetical protein
VPIKRFFFQRRGRPRKIFDPSSAQAAPVSLLKPAKPKTDSLLKKPPKKRQKVMKYVDDDDDGNDVFAADDNDESSGDDVEEGAGAEQVSMS